jgi:hypothetical protein
MIVKLLYLVALMCCVFSIFAIVNSGKCSIAGGVMGWVGCIIWIFNSWINRM